MNFEIDKNTARVLDILMQIKAINKIIDLHKKQNDHSFMFRQYKDMKGRFLMELKELLLGYEIEIEV